jgi:hypothetical protein
MFSQRARTKHHEKFKKESNEESDDISELVQNVDKNNLSCYLISMIDDVKRIFNKEKSLLVLYGDFKICGDLHGDYQSLCRYFELFGSPPTTKWIFLGDYVDRGMFSTEILLHLFLLKTMFPKQIFLLRGNHEINTPVFGSGSDWRISKLGQKLREVFDELPLCAVVNWNTVCFHGGLPDDKLSDLSSKSILPGSNGYQIVWRDFECLFTKNKRLRGGSPFNVEMLEQFRSSNGIRNIIRGHQFVENGIEIYSRGLYTISSTLSFKEAKFVAILAIFRNEKEPFRYVYGKDQLLSKFE